MRFLFLVILLLLPSISLAAPSISSVTGTVSDGQSITITGGNFGTGPTIILFDDFNGEANGASIDNTATVGTWSGNGYAGRGAPIADNQDAHSGSISIRMTNGSTWGSWRQKHVTFSAATETFTSFWFRVPNGTEWPYATSPQTFPSSSSWKYTWLTQGDNTTENDVCNLSYNGLNSHSMGGNDNSYNNAICAAGGCIGVDWVNWSGWMRFSGWLKANESDPTANGDIFYQILNGSTQVNRSFTTIPIFDSDVTTNSNKNWTSIRFPGNFELSSGGDYQILYDDIYFAAGSNSAARIEIGDSATYSSCKNLTVITPTSWSSNSAVATVRQGSFSDAESAYLFVIDANNTPSAGYPITIAGSGGGSNVTCYKDTDGDLYSDGTSEVVTSCSTDYYLVGDLTSTSGDCNDNDATIHPGATDICGDGIDQDCVGGDASCAPTTIRCATPVSIRGMGR